MRIIAQYFYPQSQTKLMNEGCATYTHYRIMNRLHEKGLLTDGNMVEFLRSHTNVVFQPDFDDPRYSGHQPYALGFAMMRDIERICTEPTAEDMHWFPAIAGASDPMAVLRDVWANYRDESFILQFLSPRLIREFGLFHVLDDSNEQNLRVEAIHDERGYRRIQRALARQDNDFNHSLMIGLRYNFKLQPPPPPPPATYPAQAPARSYLVFFDWDKATLTDRARQIISEAATNSTKVQYTRIEVNGYTDTSGTPKYNQGLSIRRAKAVEAELVKDGVPDSAITIQGFGDTHLLVPTGPGVREPQNRRVEIIIK